MHHELKMAAAELGPRVVGLVVEHRGRRVALTYVNEADRIAGAAHTWVAMIDLDTGPVVGTAIGNGLTFLAALDAAVADADTLVARAEAEGAKGKPRKLRAGRKPPLPASAPEAVEPGPGVHRDDKPDNPPEPARERPRPPPATSAGATAIVRTVGRKPERITLDALFAATTARDPEAIADALGAIFTPGLRGSIVDLPVERAPELLAALATAATLCPERQAEVVYLLGPLTSAWRDRLFRLELTGGGS